MDMYLRIRLNSSNPSVRIFWSQNSKERSLAISVEKSKQARIYASCPTAFSRTPNKEKSAQLSPNGRHLAYEEWNESGRDVYVMPFPDGGGKSQVSFFGGTSARWSPQGNELFYEKWDNEDRSMSFMIVSVETKGTFKAGRPRKLFNAPQGVDIRFLLYHLMASGF